MINEDQEEKEGIEVSRFYPSDEPNPMSGHKNKLLPSDEGMNKTSNHGNNKKIGLTTPEDNFSAIPNFSLPTGIRESIGTLHI